MLIETEFVVGGLEYSKTLNKRYTWEELKAIDFKFDGGWRVPYRDELIRLFNNVEESRNCSFIWSASFSALNSDLAWVVYFGYGNFYGNGRRLNRTNSCGVRLVRDI